MVEIGRFMYALSEISMLGLESITQGQNTCLASPCSIPITENKNQFLEKILPEWYYNDL